MNSIGIFWLYKDTVFGHASSIQNGFQGIAGLVDAHETHVECWDNNQSFRHIFPELAHCEYQDIPRGRVLYQTQTRKFLVYLDRSLMNPANKALIAAFFGFKVAQADWRADLHYTTDTDTLRHLFSPD